MAIAQARHHRRAAQLDDAARARDVAPSEKLDEHYARPRPERRYPAGYAAKDIAAVFGD